MPRKVEKRLDDGTWETSGYPTVEAALKAGWPGARYVGGVLERGIPHGLNLRPMDAPDQRQTVEEANASSPYLHRLRPYEDAPVEPRYRLARDHKHEWDRAASNSCSKCKKEFPPTPDGYPKCEASAKRDTPSARFNATKDQVATWPMEDVSNRLADACSRANRLSDECGALRTERDELLRENAVLRRKLEKLERKTKR